MGRARVYFGRWTRIGEIDQEGFLRDLNGKSIVGGGSDGRETYWLVETGPSGLDEQHFKKYGIEGVEYQIGLDQSL